MTGPALGGSCRSSLLQYPGLAGPFDRIFERYGLTPEDVGIGKATPARIFAGNP